MDPRMSSLLQSCEKLEEDIMNLQKYRKSMNFGQIPLAPSHVRNQSGQQRERTNMDEEQSQYDKAFMFRSYGDEHKTSPNILVPNTYQTAPKVVGQSMRMSYDGSRGRLINVPTLGIEDQITIRGISENKKSERNSLFSTMSTNTVFASKPPKKEKIMINTEIANKESSPTKNLPSFVTPKFAGCEIDLSQKIQPKKIVSIEEEEDEKPKLMRTDFKGQLDDSINRDFFTETLTFKGMSQISKENIGPSASEVSSRQTRRDVPTIASINEKIKKKYCVFFHFSDVLVASS